MEKQKLLYEIGSICQRRFQSSYLIVLIHLLKEGYKNPKIYLKTRQYSLEKRF